MKEVILGASARCSHDVVCEVTGRCYLCEWEGQILRRKPPFKMRFIGNNLLEKNEIYKVMGIVTSGSIIDGPIPGLLLEGQDGKIFNRTYCPTMFSFKLNHEE